MIKIKRILTAVIGAVCVVCAAFGISLFGAAKAVASDNLTMVNGASVRIDNVTGMRFTAEMSKSAYEAVQSNVTEAGMFIMPEDYITLYGALTEENLFGANAKYSGTTETGKTRIIKIVYNGMAYSEQNSRYEIKGTISNIIEANYNRNFVARAYLKFNDGSVTLADYKDGAYVNNTRSIANIARNALADEKVKWTGSELSVLSDYTDFSDAIVGERYLPLFEQGNPQNSTLTWDSTEKAYKLSFTSLEGNERGFAINADFFHKIAQKTGATGLTLKLKVSNSAVENYLFGYWPNWTPIALKAASTTEYTEVSYDFATLAKDTDGSFKTPFICANAAVGVECDMFIKDVTVVKPYGIASSNDVFDANKLTASGLKISAGNLGFTTVSADYPVGGSGYVLKSSYTGDFSWQGASLQFGNAVIASNYKAVSVKIFIQDSAKETANLRFYKYAATTASPVVNSSYQTNRWCNITIDAETLANDNGMIEGFDFALPDSGNVSNDCVVYIDSVSLIGEVSVKNYLIENGISEYAVLVPYGATDRESKAANEFIKYFKEATGVTLEKNTAYTDGRKYISFGNTELFELSGFTANESELGEDGFKIVTYGKNILVCGGSETGTLYGSYELLSDLLNFDVYYIDSYTIDSATTIELPNLNKTEIPDIATRVVGNGAIAVNQNTKDYLRYEGWFEDFLAIGGAKTHNALELVDSADASDDWYNQKKGSWSIVGLDYKYTTLKTQLCYLARGNETSYANMVSAAVNNLKTAIIANSDKVSAYKFTFACEDDNRDYCQCKACQNDTDNNDSDRVLNFLKDVHKGVEDWFKADGAQYKKDFEIDLLAYGQFKTAPKSSHDLSAYPGIKILIAPSNFDFTSSINAEVNKDVLAQAQAWADISVNGTLLWIYSTNFYNYLVPYASTVYLQEYYQWAKSINAEWIFDQNQNNEYNGSTSGFVSSFGNLESYLASKLAWNVNANVSELTDKFFNAYFGPAAAKMKAFYNAYTEHYQSLTAYKVIGSGWNETFSASDWSVETLEGWLNQIDGALSDIESLKNTDNAAYEEYHKHIVGERISVLYLLIEYHRNDITNAQDRIDQFKQDVAETGKLRYKENGLMADLYKNWNTAASVKTTQTDLIKPYASVEVSALTLLKKDGVAVSADNYTFSDGLLALNSEYIALLGEGTHAFRVEISSDEAMDWFLTVTDNQAPSFTITVADSYDAGEITLPVAIANEGTYQNIIAVYYLNGTLVEEGATVTLEEGNYSLVVKFMRNGEFIANGDITKTLIVNAKYSYVLGTEIELTAENATTNNHESVVSGIFGAYTKVINEGEEGYIEGGTGTELKFYEWVQNFAGSFTLANEITVKDGFNYVKLRVYVESSYNEVPLHFWNITKDSSTGYTDGCTVKTVAANTWTNVYLNISDFAVDGKFTGLKLGCIGHALGVDRLATAVYIDYISVVENVYGIDDEIDAAELTCSQAFAVSFGSMTASIEDAAVIGGASDKVLKLVGGQWTAETIKLNVPITVKNGMNYIKVRMYIVSDNNLSKIGYRLYRTDRETHAIEGNEDTYYNKYAHIETGKWVNLYLEVSKFAVNGQIEGFKIGNDTTNGSATIYIDYISVTDVNYDKIDLTGSTLEEKTTAYGGASLGVGTTLEGYSLKFTNCSSYNVVRIVFAEPIDLTGKSKIMINYHTSVQCIIYFFNSAGTPITSNSQNASNGFITFETTQLSNFAKDGKLTEISLGLFWAEGFSGETFEMSAIAVE